MATKDTVRLFIPGVGHVFHAPVDTLEMDLDTFNFLDESTWGEWTWLGDVSQENLIEFETDGGEAEQKHTSGTAPPSRPSTRPRPCPARSTP